MIGRPSVIILRAFQNLGLPKHEHWFLTFSPTFPIGFQAKHWDERSEFSQPFWWGRTFATFFGPVQGFWPPGWLKWRCLCVCDKSEVILLMAEILHQLICSLSRELQGFIHPRWCGISSINCIESDLRHPCHDIHEDDWMTQWWKIKCVNPILSEQKGNLNQTLIILLWVSTGLWQIYLWLLGQQRLTSTRLAKVSWYQLRVGVFCCGPQIPQECIGD